MCNWNIDIAYILQWFIQEKVKENKGIQGTIRNGEIFQGIECVPYPKKKKFIWNQYSAIIYSIICYKEWSRGGLSFNKDTKRP